MKIEVKKLGSREFEAQDISLEEMAAQLRSGSAICASMPTQPAEFVAVSMIVRDDEALFLEHAFTKAHASLVASDGKILTILFALEQPIASVAQYRLLQGGLAAKYLGAVPLRSADHAFGGTPGAVVRTAVGGLGRLEVEQLVNAGKEQIAIRKAKDGYQLSSICVESSDVPESEYGHELPLTRIPDGEHVRCPFHINDEFSAEVITLKDGQRALACHGCRRIFVPPGAPRRYDFGAFDRVIQNLSGCAGDQVRRLKSKYLPSGVIRGEGIWLVKSPKGSGKTELLREVIETARQDAFPGARSRRMAGKALLIGHRRTLLHSMAKRLGMTCYMVPAAEFSKPKREPRSDTAVLVMDDEEPDDWASWEAEGDSGVVRIRPKPLYAVCLDSLPVLHPESHSYPVVIIDECEQVFAHLVGSTLKDRRGYIFKLLQHYLRVAKQIVLLDADLGMITMQSLFGMNLRPEVPMRFVNDPVPTGATLKLYEDAGQLVETLKQAVRSGKKVFVAVNAKQKAKELARALIELNPGRRIEVIHAENAQALEMQQLIQNLTTEFEGSLQVLIASPALATGVDISFFDKDGQPRTVVEQVFGMFRNNITTHFEIDQHLFRVRHPKEVHVWVDRTEMNFEPDPAAVRAELLRTVARESVLLGFTDEGKPVRSDDALIDIWTEVKAAERGSKNVLRQAFTELRRSNLSSVVGVDFDEEANKAGKVTLSEARQQRIDSEATCIEDADDLDDDELKELQRRLDEGLPVKERESFAVRKAWLSKFYKVGVDAELVKFDDEGTTRRAIQNLELMLTETAHEASLRAVEAHMQNVRGRSHKIRKQIMASMPTSFDIPMAASKREVLRGLIAAVGLFNSASNAFNFKRKVRHRDLASFVKQVESERHRLTTLFEMPVRTDLVKKPMQQLGQILALVGQRMKQAGTHDDKGAKVREYQLDEERLAALQAIIDRRKASADGAKVHADADKATRHAGPSDKMLAQIEAWRA